ncbi:DUF742 domain-containing protein [Streptomyces oceani]|uniref:DUF742 domain-containing protein n=1 Tax=Streptomyces oceani TaxID=1075402 RepID=A0A1E7JVB3_9ACTN|nr:DUF742 domain-containing protein [Streptomyces oceani]OEU94412.1 hypothetical protein AN216_24320 [Streptomyces oceani]
MSGPDRPDRPGRTSRSAREESPDRLYTVTGGRSHSDPKEFDLVTLVVSECSPTITMQSEHAAILRICQSPTAVVELAADLDLPISIVRILLGDLLSSGRITARHPRSTATDTASSLPDPDVLKQVLVGLRNL